VNFYDDIDAFGDATAFITESSDHLSYRTVVLEADRLKQQLGGRCLVFIVCRNTVEAIVGYLGCLRAKAVPILIGENIDGEFFNSLLEQYRPEYIWLSGDRTGELKSCSRCHAYGDYVLLKTSFVVDYALHADLAMLMTTSGSTGSPKLVRLTYNNINSNTDSIAEYLSISSSDRPITTLPMAYTFGLSILNSHLLNGCAIILTDMTLMDKGFWELLKAHDATTFSGVPYTFEILKKLRFFTMKLPGLKVITQAGGKLSRELSEEFAIGCKERAISFIVMYGQAEASPRMSYLPGEVAVLKAGSIGRAIPGGEFWIEDDNGRVINDSDSVGELVYRGENVCAGYSMDRMDLGKGDENGGILKTGDLAERDSDGYYYIVGRQRRFLKLFGNRINLDEVEQILKDAGYDCACTGEDDRMTIYVTTRERHREIRKFISERTRINAAGFRIEWIETIPRNDAGKALYRELGKNDLP